MAPAWAPKPGEYVKSQFRLLSSTFRRALIAVLLTTLGAPLALAGNSSGGGGMGMVCHNPDGSIDKVILLDLWEANVLYGLRLMDSPSRSELNDKFLLSMTIRRLSSVINWPMKMDTQRSQDGHAVNVGFRMANGPQTLKGPGVTTETGAGALYYLLRMTIAPFFDATIPMAKTEIIQRVRGEKFDVTNDIFRHGPEGYAWTIPANPIGCDLQQIVVYQDTGKHRGIVKINQDLVDHMDPLNEMALYAHEALYKALRDFGGLRESLPVRRAIGLAFSESNHIMNASDWTDRSFRKNYKMAVQELTKRGLATKPVP
jgi:hypothetical protein